MLIVPLAALFLSRGCDCLVLPPPVTPPASSVREGDWLTTDEDFTESCRKRKTWRMDAFYRQVRKRTGVLMDGDRPFAERAELDGQGPSRFCVDEYDYLRAILPSQDPADGRSRPGCY